MTGSKAGLGGWPLLAATFIAVAWGTIARFKGLGTWPFGIDEYYVARSVEFILNGGLPEYPCGGYYIRGLLYQYFVAALRFGGLGPEFAGRLVTAVASLATLPAIYLLGRRLHGHVAGLLAVIVLSLSVWEIEMARFARMYAPFQAVFAWYLLSFLRYTVDKDKRALKWMIVLSIVGALTWEGGALMGLANLLPPLLNLRGGKLTSRQWVYLGGMVLLFASLYATTLETRYFGAVPPFLAEAVSLGGAAVASGPPALFRSLFAQASAWWVAALAVAVLAFASLRYIRAVDGGWMTRALLLAVLGAALAHQLLLAGALLALGVLLGLLGRAQAATRGAGLYLACLASAAVFWLAFGVFADAWPGGEGLSRLVALAYQLIGFPNVVDELVRPWGATLPFWTLTLGAGLAVLAVRVALRPVSTPSDIAALLALVLVLALAIGASAPPRHETRYAFFLYPLLVMLAVVAVAQLSELWLAGPALRTNVAIAGTLLLFVVTEDFQPRHLRNIDSHAVTFRQNMSPGLAAHYYPRSDFNTLTAWLDARVTADDIVVSGVPAVPQYYPRTNYSYLDEQDDRYTAYACRLGTVERWTNLPLLYPMAALEPLVQSGRRIFVVLYPDRQDRLIEYAQARGWKATSYLPLGPEDVRVLVLGDPAGRL
jgi:hypothetical protein